MGSKTQINSIKASNMKFKTLNLRPPNIFMAASVYGTIEAIIVSYSRHPCSRSWRPAYDLSTFRRSSTSRSSAILWRPSLFRSSSARSPVSSSTVSGRRPHLSKSDSRARYAPGRATQSATLSAAGATWNDRSDARCHPDANPDAIRRTTSSSDDLQSGPASCR